jgi:NADH-quinone oxidoreductase subunit N
MFLGSSLFLSLILSTNNLFLMIFIIMGMSICFYVLLAINSKFGAISREAGIKYFILSALSSTLILGGAKEIYLISGTATFNNINDFLILLITDYTTIHEIFAIKYALIFIFAGFLFKLSAAPNHF